MQLRRDIAAMASATAIGTVPTRVDLIIYQGDDFYLNVTLTDTENNPVDLTPYTPKAQIKASTGGQLQAEFEAAISPPNTITLHLRGVDAKVVAATAVWDLQISDAADVVTTIIFGSVTCQREVTT